MVEVLRLTKDKGLDPERVSFTPKHLADLLSMVEKKEVSAQNAKKVFEKVFDEDIDPVVYIEENGLKIVEDTGLLTETVKKIVDANPGPLAELLGGKPVLRRNRSLMQEFPGGPFRGLRSVQYMGSLLQHPHNR